MTSAAGVYYYHANQIYSIAALTDSTGVAVERYTYDPYGKVTVLNGSGMPTGSVSAVGNPWTFTGRRLDGETGLMYYRARMYSTELGRFVGRDPIGYRGSKWNLLVYCANHPSYSGDPFGLKEFVFNVPGPDGEGYDVAECKIEITGSDLCDDSSTAKPKIVIKVSFDTSKTEGTQIWPIGNWGIGADGKPYPGPVGYTPTGGNTSYPPWNPHTSTEIAEDKSLATKNSTIFTIELEKCPIGEQKGSGTIEVNDWVKPPVAITKFEYTWKYECEKLCGCKEKEALSSTVTEKRPNPPYRRKN